MNEYRIRPYRPADLAAVYEVNLRTGDAGQDATDQLEHPRVLGHIYVGPYITLEPRLAFVLEDDQGVCGYVLGVLDTHAFLRRYREAWLPPLQAEFPHPTAPWDELTRTERCYRRIHEPEPPPPVDLERFPSHLHIDLLPRAQGQGNGGRMMERLLNEMTSLGSVGTHLEMHVDNERAFGFYRKLGFEEVSRRRETLWMAKALESSHGEADVGHAEGAPDTAAERYVRAARAVLDEAWEASADDAERAAAWVAETIAGGGLLYITGSGHSHMLAEEIFYRAGGSMAVSPLLEPSLMLHQGAIRSSELERIEGTGRDVVEDAGVGRDDLLIVASNSGRNAYPIDAALAASDRGCRTIALTSLPHSRSVASRHSSGRRLFEVCDLVLDTRVPYGDAVIDLGDAELPPVGAVSTLSGALLLNALMSRAAEMLLRNGDPVPVFRSANVDAKDQGFSRELAEYRERIRRL